MRARGRNNRWAAMSDEKSYEIIVNAKKKTWNSKEIGFQDVVNLAEGLPKGHFIVYTVTYRKGGNEQKPSGTLEEGQSTRVKDGMVFEVEATDRS
jgi:hypothetical protein